jgi:serine/threonine-protein kinase RsbW
LSQHTLTVPGTLDSLSLIRDFVKSAAAEAGTDRKRAYRLQLAVDEIATNIVTHGYAETGSAGNLELRSWLTDETLVVSIEDTAMPYNPLEQAVPLALDAPLEERPTGGLGVYLAIRNVDSFLYERDGNRNRNIFIINRAGQ